MPTKTDKILSYLPGTFRSLPQPNALRSVVDAFGTELLKGENSLAALMMAHWVDHADRGAELIQDLAFIASLYGLRPRGAEPQSISSGQIGLPVAADESVEEFREHLKRYVKIFLEGTVTVQGLLRVAAESLGLSINDEYADLDTWWTRDSDALVDVVRRGDDAAGFLLGIETADVQGHAAQAARVAGNVDLFGEIDLGEGAILQLKIDDAEAVKIELPPQAQLNALLQALNTALAAKVAAHGQVASRDANRLMLASPTVGPAGRIEILDTPGDAALRLLGIPPHVYHGISATSARVSSLDFDGTVDLSEARFLRLLIDGKLLAEIDCAARSADKKHAKLEEIAKAINEAFSKEALAAAAPVTEIATQVDGVLTLTSPTEGAASSIAFQSSAAQDAREKLFGAISTSHAGSAARQATVKGLRDLRQGVDLSDRSLIRVRIDGRPALTIDCAGATPANTLLDDITAAINDALSAPLATHDGRFISLISTQSGPAALLKFETLPEAENAADLIFGILPRIFSGTLATSARLVGTPDLSQETNLGALNKLLLAIDGTLPKEVDLRSHAPHPPILVTPAQIAEAINAAFEESLGEKVAFDDGNHLIIASPIAGSASRITVAPIEVNRRRRFVTRAFVSDEAAPKLFGFSVRRAQGSGATRTQVVGAKDLSRGVDLRVARYLRLRIDDQPPIEIDCAGQRPRVTELKEILAAINTKIVEQLGLDTAPAPPFAASPDNKKLTLTSLQAGAASRMVFEEPRGVLARLGFEPGVYRGSNGTGINFVGTVDLSKGVDLSSGGKIKLSTSAKLPIEFVEIDCAKPDDPQHTQLKDIVAAINKGIGASVARTDSLHVILNLPAGADSRIEFAAPAVGDATKKIFGITAPRVYQGTPSQPARVVGSLDLSAGVDLRGARMLRLAVDGDDPVEIDCSLMAIAQPDEEGNLPRDPRAAVKLQQIPLAFASVAGIKVEIQNNRLIIKTETTGPTARLDLFTFPGDDAQRTLLGDADTTAGSDPLPAQIVGEADLISPVNLAARSVIKIAINNSRPIEIDAGGSAPQNTLLIEAVDRINSAFPGLASATNDNRLVLTSPTTGDESRVELLPTGALELIEYPPVPASFPLADEAALMVRHGDGFVANNEGAAESDLRIEIFAPQGAAQPAFVNRTTNQMIRLNETLRPGERAEVWSDGLLRASITDADGMRRDLPRTHITAAPLVAQVAVPFTDWRNLPRNGEMEPLMLMLHNSLAPASLLLRTREDGESGILVSVVEADLTATYEGLSATAQETRLIGRVRARDGDFWLTDAKDKPVARLRVSAPFDLKEYLNRVVAVTGALHQVGDDERAELLLIVEGLTELFDVKVQGMASDGQPGDKDYTSVTIGHGTPTHDSLFWQINFGDSPSQLVRAVEANHGAALRLPRGQSQWSYIDCGGGRFDQAFFDDPNTDSNFAGIVYEPCAELAMAECQVISYCEERGVFDISRFRESAASNPPQIERVVFAPSPLSDPPVEIRLRWSQFQPGALIVKLPADLPEPFGGRFDQARFASDGDAVEEYLGVVTEPADDPDHIVHRLATSRLVTAQIVPRVELGFTAVPLPIAQPRWRKLGGDDPARIYLVEKDVPDSFIKLSAARDGELAEGPWGKQIVITARKSSAGPARFDLTISYQGGRFENACQVVRGGETLPARIEDFLRPGAIGILQAKAAGIHAEVTREGADDLG